MTVADRSADGGSSFRTGGIQGAVEITEWNAIRFSLRADFSAIREKTWAAFLHALSAGERRTPHLQRFAFPAP